MTTQTLEAGRIRRRGAGLFAKALARALTGIERGTLIIEDGDASLRFGAGEPRAKVTVRRPSFYRRVALGGTVGAGEAYMDGDWDCDDLVGLMRTLLANAPAMAKVDGSSTLSAQLGNFLQHLFRRNSRAGSRKNIRAHYDLSNAFFSTFLDQQMMYSSAVYEHEGASLEEASLAKLERLCRKLELSPDDHLLEVGTGWGGLAVYAASRFGCRVTTVTISREQFDAARARVRDAGLSSRVDVLLRDYRDVEGQFDKIVSVEMVEAVGHQYLDQYFRVLGRLLRPEGLMVLQAITIEDRRYRQALRSVDFIKKHIFPGSFIPSVSALVSSAAAQSETVLVNLEDIGFDYARTLRAWSGRFEARLAEVEALGFDDAFVRMWRFYLAYCEAGFLERAISDVQMVFAGSRYRRQPWRALLNPSLNEGIKL